MKVRKSWLFLGVIAIALGLSLLSSPATQAYTVTLDKLLAGENVTIGDKIFQNWRNYSSIASGGALPVNPVNVTLFFTEVTDSLYRIDYQTGSFAVGRNEYQDTRFTYDVAVVGGIAKIHDNGLELISFGLGDNTKGIINISETIFDAAGNTIGTKLVQNNKGVIINPAHFEWDPPVAFITINKDIALTGLDEVNGGAFISDFDQTFSQIPEPTTLILLGSGLLGAALYRRLRKHKG